MNEPASTEVQPALFPDLPEVNNPKPSAPEAQAFDPMSLPGEPQFPGWDPHGTSTFHGPASD